MKISLMSIIALFLLPLFLFAEPDSPIQLPKGAPVSQICVLGGTNIAEAFTRTEYIRGSFTIETPFGKSPLIYYGEVKGVPFYHIPLHGGIGVDRKNREEIHKAPLRTWSALHHLGVTEVLGGASAGAINPDYKLGDWVVADDFIDFNVERPRSIAYQVLGDAAANILPRVNPATDPHLDEILYQASLKHAKDVQTWKGGVIAQAAAGRFETVAEIKMMRMLGCDLVTMSVPTEIAYARQLGMNYGSIIGISNPAEGLGEWDWGTLTGLYPRFHEQSIKIYVEAIPLVAKLAGIPRAGDALRIHPDLEPKKEK